MGHGLCGPNSPEREKRNMYNTIIHFTMIVDRIVHIMLNVSHYYANSLCSTNVTFMLK